MHTSHVRYSNRSQWEMYESVDELWLLGGHMVISMLGFVEMFSTWQTRAHQLCPNFFYLSERRAICHRSVGCRVALLFGNIQQV